MVDLQEKKTFIKGNAAGAGVLSRFEPLGVLSGLIGRGIKLFRDEKNQLNIKAVNAVLLSFTVLLTLYYINGISVSINRINNTNLGNFLQGKDSPASASKELSALNQFSFYQEILKKRDIFQMGERLPLDSPEVISSKAAEASKNLRLVGISWSDNPDVMIEDTKLGKTFFVKKEQMVGDFKVEEVYKDRIVLRYGAESIELR